MKKFINAVGEMYHSVIYTDTDGRHFRFPGGTWTWRNHNPGNVWSGRISKKHNQIGETHHFAIFPDDKSGHASLLDTLITTYGNSSIHDMIYSYAPPKENPTKNMKHYFEKILVSMTIRQLKSLLKINLKNFGKQYKRWRDIKLEDCRSISNFCCSSTW